MSANRFDEGYSEETRSQHESDLVMRSDMRLSDGEMEPDSPFILPDWVLALSENERSGMLEDTTICPIHANPMTRICIRHPALAANLINSRHR
jgi:hypothetical protein